MQTENLDKLKAVVIKEFGPADVLMPDEVDKPVPGDNQVLIKVKATGINPVDTKVRAGTHISCKNLKLPVIIGWDVSGVIEECGKEVSEFRIGDQVFGAIGFPGLGRTYAEFAVADTKQLAVKPRNVSFEEAAAIPIVGMTSWQVINDHLQIKKGQQVLIQAAAGGVGHISVQLAKLKGAQVYATASAGNEHFLKTIGADEFIDYKVKRFEDIATGIDAVQEAIGGDILYRSIRCLKRGGRIVCLPSSTKNDPKAIEIAREHEVELTWPMMYQSKDQLKSLAELMASGKLKVQVSKVFSLDEIVEAHRQVESHRTAGKVVVKIS